MTYSTNAVQDAPVAFQPSNKTRLQAVQKRLEAYHDQLQWAVDALIPADPTLDMPSASQIDLVGKYLPEVLLLRDDMAEEFYSAIAQLPREQPDNALAELQKIGPKYFECFTRLIAGAFFLDPQINSKLGYGGQEPIWETPDYDELVESIE